MKYLKSKVWWEAAGTRAIKTFAQAFISVAGVSSVISAVDWKMAVSSAALSALLSLMTSLAGLPEVEE